MVFLKKRKTKSNFFFKMTFLVGFVIFAVVVVAQKPLLLGYFGIHNIFFCSFFFSCCSTSSLFRSSSFFVIVVPISLLVHCYAMFRLFHLFSFFFPRDRFKHA
jgi:hypothetical protein